MRTLETSGSSGREGCVRLRSPPKASARSLARRHVLQLIAAVPACISSVNGQERRAPVIGYLGSEMPEPYASRLKAFRTGLEAAGYVEGRNLTIQFRWAEGRYERLPALAQELVSQHVSLMVAAGGASVALAAKKATTSIPIVFELGGDPVALGLARSLSRPEGNLTGISSLSVEVSPKRLEFMHELFPAAPRFIVAANPTSPTAEFQLKDLRAAAESLGLELEVVTPRSEAELDAVITGFTPARAAAIVFTSDPYFAFRSQQLAGLAVAHAVPAIMQTRDFAIAGGLMSYGGDFEQSHRFTGIYAGRILNGERLSDLPVQQVTKLELFLNLTAARHLGITFPPSLVGIADRVVE
jgi:putative ABC transport system substrate-binding protein